MIAGEFSTPISTPPTLASEVPRMYASVISATTWVDTLPETAWPVFWPPLASPALASPSALDGSPAWAAASVAVTISPSFAAFRVVLPVELNEPTPVAGDASKCPAPVATLGSRRTIVAARALASVLLVDNRIVDSLTTVMK